MAAAVTNKGLLVDQTKSIWRSLSSSSSLFNFTRSYSATVTIAPPSSPATDGTKKPKRKKKKNLFEVAQFLPNWGLGYHMAKTHWVGVSYQITKINLYKDGRHGKAWGIVHKEGHPGAEAPKKISGVHKRGWKYIANLSKTPISGLGVSTNPLSADLCTVREG